MHYQAVWLAVIGWLIVTLVGAQNRDHSSDQNARATTTAGLIIFTVPGHEVSQKRPPGPDKTSTSLNSSAVPDHVDSLLAPGCRQTPQPLRSRQGIRRGPGAVAGLQSLEKFQDSPATRSGNQREASVSRFGINLSVTPYL